MSDSGLLASINPTGIPLKNSNAFNSFLALLVGTSAKLPFGMPLLIANWDSDSAGILKHMHCV